MDARNAEPEGWSENLPASGDPQVLCPRHTKEAEELPRAIDDAASKPD
jgi:hypothetical protein